MTMPHPIADFGAVAFEIGEEIKYLSDEDTWQIEVVGRAIVQYVERKASLISNRPNCDGCVQPMEYSQPGSLAMMI